MKEITRFIKEGLKITSKTKVDKYAYHPKTKEELQKLVDDPKVDLRKIDTSKITDMSCLISFAQSSRTDFSGIENGDTSHVTDMSGMFYCCDRFNQDISSWDVSSVKDMSHMFWGV